MKNTHGQKFQNIFKLLMDPLSYFPQGGNGHLPPWGKEGKGVNRTP
jgi:hypothetical protein